MLARLYVIIESEDIKDYQMIKDLLLQINPNFSISPSREYAGKKDCSEFFVTANLDVTEVPLLLERLNNDWDGEIDDCSCYGFNTGMFHDLVYYLEFALFE